MGCRQAMEIVPTILLIISCLSQALAEGATEASSKTECLGKTYKDHFVATRRMSYIDAKRCCEDVHMELLDVNEKTTGIFLEIVGLLNSAKLPKEIYFWAKTGTTHREASTGMCPSNFYTFNPSTFTFAPKSCSSKSGYICGKAEEKAVQEEAPQEETTEDAGTEAPLEDRKDTILVPMAQSTVAPPTTTAATQTKTPAASILAKAVSCHLIPLENGLYFSKETLNFFEARSCCMGKGFRILWPKWLGEEREKLTSALVAFAKDNDVGPLWSVPRNKSCYGMTVGSDNVRDFRTACGEPFHAMCENPSFSSDTCSGIQYQALMNDKYLLSDRKVTYKQAQMCCQSQGKVLTILDYTESSDLFKLRTEDDKIPDTFWTGIARPFNSPNFNWQGKPFGIGKAKEYCLGAVSVLEKEDFLLTDFPCEQTHPFVCIDQSQKPLVPPPSEFEHEAALAKREFQEPASPLLLHV